MKWDVSKLVKNDSNETLPLVVVLNDHPSLHLFDTEMTDYLKN